MDCEGKGAGQGVIDEATALGWSENGGSEAEEQGQDDEVVVRGEKLKEVESGVRWHRRLRGNRLVTGK